MGLGSQNPGQFCLLQRSQEPPSPQPGVCARGRGCGEGKAFRFQVSAPAPAPAFGCIVAALLPVRSLQTRRGAGAPSDTASCSSQTSQAASVAAGGFAGSSPCDCARRPTEAEMARLNSESVMGAPERREQLTATGQPRAAGGAHRGSGVSLRGASTSNGILARGSSRASTCPARGHSAPAAPDLPRAPGGSPVL